MDVSIYRLRHRDILALCVIALVLLGVLMVQSAAMNVTGQVKWQWTERGTRHAMFALVALFTFIILLSTLGALVPYVICSLAAVLGRPGTVSAGVAPGPAASAVALAALAYSILAVIGAGGQVLALGTLAFVAGLPVFYWSRRQRLAPSMHA